MSSSVESEPLVVSEWLVVLNSNSILVASNMLMPRKCSSTTHSGSELELDSIVQWLSWIGNGSLVNPPTLVGTIVAVPEDNMPVVSVRSTMNIKAFTAVVSDVSNVA